MEENKVVLLLGAGFAIPFGAPSSQTIRKRFEQDSQYGTIAELIFKILDTYYGGVGHANFETFIAALETIAYYEFSNTNINKDLRNSNLLPSIFSLDTTLQTMLDTEAKKKHPDYGNDALRNYIWELRNEFIQIIINEISNYDFYNQSAILSQQESIAFIDYIKYLQNTFNKVKIYTTNYDRLVQNIIGANLYEALDKNGHIIYDIEKFVNNNLTCFNLHGSIYWHRNTYYDIQTKESPYQMNGNFLVPGGNPSEPVMYSPIVAGYSKTQRAFSNPFDLGFTCLAYDLNTCDKIITIGVSFNDSHINSIMDDFKRKGIKTLDITYDTTKVKIDKNVNQNIYNGGLTDFLNDKDNWTL